MKRLFSLLLVFLLVLPMGACAQEGGENMANSSGSKLSISVGQMMDYNGVELPDINTVWTDKKTYPYAVITTDESHGIVLVVASRGFGHYLHSDGTESIGIYYDVKYRTFVLSDDGQAFTLVYEGDSGGYLSIWRGDTGETVLWSSHDILNEDGTVYFAASDPVPVGDAITDTTATLVFNCSNLLYTDAVYHIKAWCYPKGIDYWTAPATWESDLFGGTTHGESKTFEGLLPGTEYEVYAVIYGTDGATEHNATVTFTTAEGGTEPVLLLVANQVMGNGFNLYLLTKNLEATDYTAEVTVFTDGGAVAFYGELTIDGSGIDYITVTGLEPLTEYTAAVDIYPSPNGEVILHGEHTVTTTDEIPVVGYDRDSFLLGFASGLGATAATKDGADYNTWAQGYIVGCSLRKAL